MAGGSKQPQSTTTVNQMYSPEEAAMRAKVMAEAERIYGTTAPKVAGQTAPGMIPETVQAQEMMKRLAGANPLSGMAGQMKEATEFGMSGVLDPASNPALQGRIDSATKRVGQAYTDPGGVISRISNQFDAGSSGGSSTREGIAGGIAGREYLNTIGDVAGGMEMDAYNKGLDVFGRTMALAPQNMNAIMGAETTPANILGAVGQQNEAYEAMIRDWEMSAPWAALGPYANVVTGMGNPSTQTTTSGTAPGKSLMQPLGAAMMGASLGSMVPGIGAPVGAAAGLMMGLFS